MTRKPFAPAAEQNRHDILAVLQQELHATEQVLELGSGSGQHVCHFASAMTTTFWQPSELAQNLSGIESWIADSGCQNIHPPIELDIRWSDWPKLDVQGCYSANTLHIVDWGSVTSLFAGCGRLLPASAKLLIYGPYRINGEHTAPSNQRFDAMLRAGDPNSGVRDVQDLDALATINGFGRARLIEMPVNNFIAVWEKSG